MQRLKEPIVSGSRTTPPSTCTFTGQEEPLLSRVTGARQKERRQALEQMVVSVLARDTISAPASHGQSSSTNHAPSGSISNISPDEDADSFEASLARTDEPGISHHELFRCLFKLPEKQRQKCFAIVARENFTLRDIVRYGLMGMGHAVDPNLTEHGQVLPFDSWLNYVGIDAQEVCHRGVEVLSQLNAPVEWPGPDDTTPSTAQHTTTAASVPSSINLKSMSYLPALVSNAVQLRITLDHMVDQYAQSHFFGPQAATIDTPDGPVTRASHVARLAPDLSPTSAQKNIPHHPYIDLIPWPAFRTKVLMEASRSPPAINEDDLCLDLLGGGVQCWGTTMTSMHGRGNGTPWNAYSWEAMPWFLEKWKMLIGDETSEIARISAWWRGMRGIEVM
jgi:hypothetical protein